MNKNKSENHLKALKLTIKNWESEFTKINQRKPLKEDIQEAPSTIKEAYKAYWNLKKKTELQEINREDVWSEKLNKSKQKSLKIEHTNGIIKKFCDKIRERSSNINQMKFEKSPEKKVPVNKLNFSEKNEGDLCKERSFSTETDSIFTLNNSENEIEIIKKPTKRIIKVENVSKRCKPVNMLSASVDTKNLGNKLSFETSIDDKWLERCCKDFTNDSAVNDTPVQDTIPHKRKLSVDLNGDGNVHKAIIEHFPSNDNSENLNSEAFNHSDFTEHLNNYSGNIPSKEEVPSVNGLTSQTESAGFHDEYNSINSSHLTNIKTSEVLSSEVESKPESIRESKKRKLTRTYGASSGPLTHLEKKMASGSLNENFVKVNIKKKKFSRGHKSINVKKLKWKKWKEQKKFREINGSTPTSSNCFKCGQVGHWARNCTALTKKEEFEDTEFEDKPLPTLEEVAALASESKIDLMKGKTVYTFKSAEILSKDNSEVNNLPEESTPFTSVKPVYEPTADGKLIETPVEVFDSLKELGYSGFRNGQELAVMRILSGLSTLVVLPTGSGKSLCYQLPAYIYAKHVKCITLVVSPLVSLMEDQIIGLPSGLHAICLHSGMTDVQKKASLQDLSDGKAQIVLMSPEAVIGGFAFGSSMSQPSMPPIAFACIDEAHCLSQWSHNFRPSYLQLYKVLTEQFNVKCILGLTATANRSTTKEITSHLGLKNLEESVVGSTAVPENLHLSVSRDKDKDKALIQLLMGDRFNSCSSIIIYCIRRDETERLATLIRTCLQDQISDEPQAKKTKSKSKKRNFLWTAEAYHAGLVHARRRSIQKQFMNGKLRVIVATIAFGMGLDKRNVRAIIHYNMPKSFESYVQEIGRAGRDGLDAHCHLFLDNEGKDNQELQRFIYSNSTDRYVIRKLLKKVFISGQCKLHETKNVQSSEDVKMPSGSQCQAKYSKHEIAFSINDTIQELDLKEETILTLLCYLELHSKKWIEVLPPTYSTCTIRCYGGPKQLQALASTCPPVAAAFALDPKRNKLTNNTSTYEFAVVEVASAMRWNTSSVKRVLKNLEWNDQKRKTGVIVEFSNLAFHLQAPCNLSNDELDEVLDFLYQKVITSEKKELSNLKLLHSVFSKYSYAHYWECSAEAPLQFSQAIKESVNNYFDESNNSEDIEDLKSQNNSEDSNNVDVSDVRSQIRDLIFTNNDQNFTGRAIARIFHGIGSPCFPAEVWGRVRRFWRCLLHVNFNYLLKLANEELKRVK